MLSTCGTTITAADFSDSTADPLRNVWTGGKLRAVIAALVPGERVGIVTDRQTGMTVFGVELLAATGGSGSLHSSGDHALIRYHHSEDGHQDTHHRARSMGPIFAARSAVKWDALSWWREQVRAAMAVARPIAEAEHGQTYGAWTGTVTRYGVHMKYEPQRPDAGPVGYGEVRDGRLMGWSTYGGYVGSRGSYRDHQAAARS